MFTPYTHGQEHTKETGSTGAFRCSAPQPRALGSALVHPPAPVSLSPRARGSASDPRAATGAVSCRAGLQDPSAAVQLCLNPPGRQGPWPPRRVQRQPPQPTFLVMEHVTYNPASNPASLPKVKSSLAWNVRYRSSTEARIGLQLRAKDTRQPATRLQHAIARSFIMRPWTSVESYNHGHHTSPQHTNTDRPSSPPHHRNKQARTVAPFIPPSCRLGSLRFHLPLSLAFAISDTVLLSARPPVRAVTAFMTWPMALGPDTPSSAIT